MFAENRTKETQFVFWCRYNVFSFLRRPFKPETIAVKKKIVVGLQKKKVFFRHY